MNLPGTIPIERRPANVYLNHHKYLKIRASVFILQFIISWKVLPVFYIIIYNAFFWILDEFLYKSCNIQPALKEKDRQKGSTKII